MQKIAFRTAISVVFAWVVMSAWVVCGFSHPREFYSPDYGLEGIDEYGATVRFTRPTIVAE